MDSGFCLHVTGFLYDATAFLGGIEKGVNVKRYSRCWIGVVVEVNLSSLVRKGLNMKMRDASGDILALKPIVGKDYVLKN